jgi:hypothetical protein
VARPPSRATEAIERRNRLRQESQNHAASAVAKSIQCDSEQRWSVPLFVSPKSTLSKVEILDRNRLIKTPLTYPHRKPEASMKADS